MPDNRYNANHLFPDVLVPLADALHSSADEIANLLEEVGSLETQVGLLKSELSAPAFLPPQWANLAEALSLEPGAELSESYLATQIQALAERAEAANAKLSLAEDRLRANDLRLELGTPVADETLEVIVREVFQRAAPAYGFVPLPHHRPSASDLVEAANYLRGAIVLQRG